MSFLRVQIDTTVFSADFPDLAYLYQLGVDDTYIGQGKVRRPTAVASGAGRRVVEHGLGARKAVKGPTTSDLSARPKTTNQCKADGHSDTEFPGVTMCMSKQGFARVHGCMWCGETTHARPQCVGPTLPASQVQMTLAEWQKFEPHHMRTHQEARNFDRKTYRQKDGKPTQGVVLRERSASRPRSCRPIKRADGSVET